MTRVLVVDDEADIRELVRELLARAGYDVVEAADGSEALKVFYSQQPDFVILDVQMPVLDGWETLTRIREVSDVPVLMLTARAEELDRVRGLRAGADDYLTKPFGRQELLARVSANLRRAGTRKTVPELYADGFVTIDYAQREVFAGDDRVSLTPLEFRLLTAFVQNPNQVLSHEQLLELVWGDERAAERDQVKLYVGYLRRKLGTSGDDPIETVRGFGYRYRPRA
jgi:DNA-binding response OmpR family regulator